MQTSRSCLGLLEHLLLKSLTTLYPGWATPEDSCIYSGDMQSIICSCVDDTAAEVKHTCSIILCIKINEVEITNSTTSWLGPSKQATMETEYML